MSGGDELSPRDRGLLIGDAWAKQSVYPDEVRAVAEDGADTVLCEYIYDTHPGLSERLSHDVDPDAAEVFWEGFMHGVRAFLAEQREP
jgi:hypothetical protein